MTLAVTPLPAALGAAVTGLELSRPLDEPTVAVLRQAWRDYLVLLFPALHLSNDQHLALAAVFGTAVASTSRGDDDYRGLRTLAAEGYPQILVLDNENNNADVWHTDVTFSPKPPIGSLLSMQEAPPTGGDTLWLNQYRAYETLSTPIRQAIEPLSATHGRPPMTATASHPLVATHPGSGRRCLYVNRGWTARINELSAIESRNLLNLLCEHAERPEHTVRWSWTAGDAALWDNRCTQHYAIRDYGDAYRRLHRVTIYD